MATMVRRLAVLVAVTAAGLGGVANPAAAEDVTVSGAFTARGSWGSDPSCDFAHEVANGDGDWAGLNVVTFALDFCVGIPPEATDRWPVTSGTFTVATPAGQLSGTMGGSLMVGVALPDGRFGFTYVLTIAGGTGAYAGATGELTLDGSLADYSPFGRNLEGTVSGTVTTVPPVITPTSKADCKQDGWRDLTDETGTPFSSKADCTRWVKNNL
jgi:hypothetical protein